MGVAKRVVNPEQELNDFLTNATVAGLDARVCHPGHWQIRTHAGNVNFYVTKGTIYVDGKNHKTIRNSDWETVILVATELSKEAQITKTDTHVGPMPWRLQIAAQYLAAALQNEETAGMTEERALGSADALIAAHHESKGGSAK